MTEWYADTDSDGYGDADSTATVQCVRPANHYLSGELTEVNSDCNDANFAINPGVTETIADEIDYNCDGAELCYEDADGDTYGVNSSVVSADLDCSDAGESLTSDDCDDTNNEVNPATAWYKDADGDGYSDGVNIVICADPGADYYLPSELIATSDDCDDTDGSLSPKTLRYKDNDDD